jgi:hypothetical protein
VTDDGAPLILTSGMDPPGPCPECGGTDEIPVGTVRTTDGRGYAFERPCQICKPGDWDYWSGGHMKIDHDKAICTHPRCQAASQPKGRRK